MYSRVGEKVLEKNVGRGCSASTLIIIMLAHLRDFSGGMMITSTDSGVVARSQSEMLSNDEILPSPKSWRLLHNSS
jgi:hypothetical protein